jgi:hypothetical protein
MTDAMDDLSQAVLSWLDQRPLGFAQGSPSPTWGTKELRDSFRANLEIALFASIAASKQLDVIAQLINAFKPSVAAGGIIDVHRWMVVPYAGPHAETFEVMQEEMAQLFDRETNGRGISGYPSDNLAYLIVQALNDALLTEAGRIPQEGITPEEVLHHYMIPSGIRRRYNIRTFLFFFGLLAFSAIIYGLVEPDPWLNPATGLFILLGYVTLIATAIAHQHSDVSSW